MTDFVRPGSLASVLRETVSAAAFAALLDVVPQPLLLTDASARLRHANRAADELLERGNSLLVREGRLTLPGSPEAGRLRRALGALDAVGSNAPVVLTFRRDPADIRLVLMLWPLDVPDTTGRRLLAVFADDGAASGIDASVLRRLYGLTAAEARVADLIAAGHSVAEIAVRLRVGRSTARTHLKRALAKTAVRRQAALARLLLNGPAHLRLPVRSPGAANG